MQRDLGVCLRAEQLRAFNADGAITESGAFSGAANDSYVLRHKVILLRSGHLALVATNRWPNSDLRFPTLATKEKTSQGWGTRLDWCLDKQARTFGDPGLLLLVAEIRKSSTVCCLSLNS